MASARVQKLLDEAANLTEVERSELYASLRTSSLPRDPAALLDLAGIGESSDPDIARNKHEHLADIHQTGR